MGIVIQRNNKKEDNYIKKEEILFDKGTTFKVQGTTNKCHLFYLEEDD